MNDEELKQLIASKAKAIQALAHAAAEQWKERQRSECRLNAAMGSFWEVQAGYYSPLETDERQAQIQAHIWEILNRLSQSDQ